MCPTFVSHYRPYGTLADTKHLGEFALRVSFVLCLAVQVVKPANFSDLFFCKRSGSSPLTKWVKSVLNSVAHVAQPGRVFQVISTVVAFVAVFVIDLFSFRDWPNKGGQDKTVDAVPASFSLLVKPNAMIPFFANVVLEDAPSLPAPATLHPTDIPTQALNPSRIAYLIKTLIPRYIPPLFKHNASNKNPAGTSMSLSRRHGCQRDLRILPYLIATTMDFPCRLDTYYFSTNERGIQCNH